MTQHRQILIFVDGLAAALSFENARIIFLNKQEGYPELATKISQGTYPVDGYRVVILLIGRSDVWEPDKVFFKE